MEQSNQLAGNESSLQLPHLKSEVNVIEERAFNAYCSRKAVKIDDVSLTRGKDCVCRGVVAHYIRVMTPVVLLHGVVTFVVNRRSANPEEAIANGRKQSTYLLQIFYVVSKTCLETPLAPVTDVV